MRVHLVVVARSPGEVSSLMVAEPLWRRLVAELILPLMVAELGGGTRPFPVMVAEPGGEAWWRSSPLHSW